MKVEVIFQLSRTKREIEIGAKRKETKEIIEDIESIIKDDGLYTTFRYTDGTSYSIAKDYLVSYKIL